MKKRLLSFALTLVLLVPMLPFAAFPANAAGVSNLSYTISGGKATITNCSTSASGVLEIPATLGGYPVTSIGDYAFSLCDSLTSVTIPDGVTSIGSAAFSACNSLTSVTIPDSVTTIGDYAFYICDSLTSITIPDSVTTIGNRAFSACDNLRSIHVDGQNPHYCADDGIIFSKDKSTLVCCPGKSGAYTIPDGVTTIGDSAFYHCDSLTSISIPDSVTTIGNGAFSACDNLRSIHVDGQNPHYCADDGIIFSKDKSTLVCCPGKSGAYTIPDGVTTIGDYAFECCDSLTSITIPDSVTSIGSHAFWACDSLASVTIGNGVTTIGDSTFYGCLSLTSITIPDSVTSIGSFAFNFCVSLTDVWYQGSETQKASISFGFSTDLADKIWHYNTCKADCHIYLADCDTTCENCDWTRTASHDYQGQYNEQQHYQECSGCKEKINFEDHSFDHACDTTCNGGCGYVRAPAHKLFRLTENINYLLSLQNSATDPFSYSNGVYTSTNKANNSSSTFTIEALYDCTLTIEYSVSSEENYDKLTISKGSTTLATVSGTVSGKTLTVSMKAGDLVTLKYSKDSSESAGSDSASFKVTAEGSAYVPAEEVAHFCHLPLYCDLCGEVAVEAKDHTYSGDCDTSCNECGEIRTAQNHTYSSDCDTTCNQCGDIRTAGPHLYTNSCDSTCNECGEIRAVIHSFGAYSYDNNATSLKDGTKTRTCTVCGEKDTVVVPGTKLEVEMKDSSVIFSDVKPNDWFKPSVDFVFTHEIMFGTGDGTTFSPSGIMNRAMLVTILYRLEGSPAVSGNHGFIDVGDNQWYTDAIIWASQNGIVSGKGGGRFAPTEALTRASFVSILYRYAEYCGEDVSARAALSAFADEASVPAWARANIEWAVAKGLLSGSTQNGALYINPTGKANRAQGATLLQKFCEM